MGQKLYFKDVATMREVLEQSGVPVEQYGTGAAKTLDHLFEEVISGECALRIEYDRIVRTTSVICLDIWKGDSVLVEEKQRFTADGRERRRKLDASTGEKLKQGEEPQVAAERLLKEEMPFASGYPIVFREIITTKPQESQSYPGIPTRYVKRFCRVQIPEADVPDVVVVEEDKVAYYRWTRK